MVADSSSTTPVPNKFYLLSALVRDTEGKHDDITEDGVFRDRFLTVSSTENQALVQFGRHCDDLGFDIRDPSDIEVERVTEPEQVAALAAPDSEQIRNWNDGDDSDVSASPQKLLDLLQQALSR